MYRELTLVCLSLVCSQSVLSQSAQEDENVVVTAPRNPLPAKELGSSVIVLDRRDIEVSDARTVSEILRGLPGITVRRTGGLGSNAEILIRGDKGGHTLVMIDGIEQADVTGIEKNFDIGDMPLDDVERIEIIKGPHSVAYGASGLSGVIHIVTRRPQAGTQTSVGLDLGSYNTYGSHVRVSGKEGLFGYAAAVSGVSSVGYSHAGSRDGDEADGFKRTDARLRLQYGALDSYSADLVIDGNQSVADLDAGANIDDKNYQAKSRIIGAHLAQKIRYADIFETRVGAGISQSDRRYFDDPDADNPDLDMTWLRSRYQGDRRIFDFSQAVAWSQEQSLVASAQWVRDSAAINSDASYQGYAVASDLSQQIIKEFSYALQYQWGLGERVYGQFGARTLDNSEFGGKSVGQAALKFVLVPDWTDLRFNYGRGFKTPSLYQLRTPGLGNENLRPEYVLSREVALEQKMGGGLSLSVSVFQNQTENLIIFNNDESRYYNVNQALIKGVEGGLNWDVTETLSTQAQYTHIISLDRATNKPLPSRPAESWGGNIVWKPGSFSWMTAIRGQNQSPAQPFLDGTKRFRVIDTALNWQHGAARWSMKVDNLLNRWYQEVAGYNTPGRNFSGSVEYTL